VLSSGLTTLAALAASPAAHADTGSSLGGYTVNAQALGLQFALNVPNLLPLPDQNIIEADAPFARTNVSNGPVVDALGAPYYPGDVAANLGTLLATFSSQIPPTFAAMLNDSAEAHAQYPTTPGTPGDTAFGPTAQAGLPLQVGSAVSHADANGGTVTSTLTDLTMGPVDVGSIQASNAVALAGSSVKATATSVVRTVSIAGVLDVSQLVGTSSAGSDGTTGTPASTLQVGTVTVMGMPAYIDNTGVHVAGQTPPDPGLGLTPQSAQQTLNATFAQDGITVRLADPTTTTNGAEGRGDAGGLIVSISHDVSIPFVPIAQLPPSLTSQLPLGNVGIPAGTYTVVTSMTLGSAVTDTSATVIPAFPTDNGGGAGLGTSGLDTGLGSDQGLTSSSGGFGAVPTSPTGPGTGTVGAAPSPGLALFNARPFGLPAPVGWVVAAFALCLLVMYPMLLIARWQFLGSRRR
jgi:hypothetical protein